MLVVQSEHRPHSTCIAAPNSTAYRGGVAEWLTIEVFDGAFPASQWRAAHGEALLLTALTNGGADWRWHEHRWGLVLELAFDEERQRNNFPSIPAVRAALDAVPDHVNGVLVYRGRGGGAGAGLPRRPRPTPLAGAAAMPEPDEDPLIELSAEPDVSVIAR
jgi:hypothetical protein